MPKTKCVPWSKVSLKTIAKVTKDNVFLDQVWKQRTQIPQFSCFSIILHYIYLITLRMQKLNAQVSLPYLAFSMFIFLHIQFRCMFIYCCDMGCRLAHTRAPTMFCRARSFGCTLHHLPTILVVTICIIHLCKAPKHSQELVLQCISD